MSDSGSGQGGLEVAAGGSGLEVVTSVDRFAQLAEPWDRLAATEQTPFCSHAWFSAWWDAFGEGSQLRVIVLWRGDEMTAAYPLSIADRRCEAMANVHSPLFRPLALDDSALREVTDAALRSSCPHGLVIEALPEQSEAVAVLMHAAGESGARSLQSARHVSPIVDTTGDFADWRAQSRPRWGAPLERFRRKMAREYDAEIRVVTAPESLDLELDRGFAVEASGWKGQAGTAILSSPHTARFYRDIAHAAAARDELRLSTITLDGEVAAFDLTLLRNNRLYLLKTGFDEHWRRLAPGLVLRLSVIERCFELGLDAHELLGDESEWKRKFATSSRSHVAVEVYGKSAAQLAAYTWRRTIRPALVNGRSSARRLIGRQ